MPQKNMKQMNCGKVIPNARPIPIAEDLNMPQVASIQAQAVAFPELNVEPVQRRNYPYATMAAHIMGFIGEANDKGFNKIQDRRHTRSLKVRQRRSRRNGESRRQNRRQPGDKTNRVQFSDPGRQPGENESLRAGVLVNPGLPPGVREPWAQVALGVVAGLLLIHLGGLAQLALLTGNLSAAARFGTWPFLLGDLLKLAVLVPVLTKLTPTIRARL